MEAKKATALEAVTQQRGEDIRLRRIGACCSEL
jgi:hypothetical protein